MRPPLTGPGRSVPAPRMWQGSSYASPALVLEQSHARPPGVAVAGHGVRRLCRPGADAVGHPVVSQHSPLSPALSRVSMMPISHRYIWNYTIPHIHSEKNPHNKLSRKTPSPPGPTNAASGASHPGMPREGPPPTAGLLSCWLVQNSGFSF